MADGYVEKALQDIDKWNILFDKYERYYDKLSKHTAASQAMDTRKTISLVATNTSMVSQMTTIQTPRPLPPNRGRDAPWTFPNPFGGPVIWPKPNPSN